MAYREGLKSDFFAMRLLHRHPLASSMIEHTHLARPPLSNTLVRSPMGNMDLESTRQYLKSLITPDQGRS